MMNFLPFKPANAVISGLLNLVVLAATIFTVTGFFGEQSWLLDLTTHFRLQYLAILLLAIAVLLIRRGAFWQPWLAALLLTAGLNLWQVLPFYVSSKPANKTPVVARLTVFHANVLLFNANEQAVFDAIEQSDADVVSLQEVWGRWPESLDQSPVLKRYPYKVPATEAGNVLYSRLPLSNMRVVPINVSGPERLTSKNAIIYADLLLKDYPVTLIAFHPPVPGLPSYAAGQFAYIKQLASDQPRWHPDVVLVGDLNTTPWSVFYRGYLKATGLKDTRSGYGISPTWPSYMPIFFIPIDHVFVSEHFHVLQYKTAPFTGSDHLPVYVELGLKSNPAFARDLHNSGV